MSKSNRIEFDSNIGCLRIYFNNCDEYFLCDIEDRDIAEKYCWRKNNEGYVVTDINNKKNHAFIRFHRLVMEKYYGDLTNYVIDHQDHNKLNNRKYNLRKCTQGNNRLNSVSQVTNTGLKYITCNKGYYQVKIDNKYIGCSKYPDQAIKIRDDYLKDYPNKFRYNPDEDSSRRDNKNIIYPFIFIEKEK